MTGARGGRMKSCAARESARRFLSMLPVRARIDGRGSSNVTRGLDRPSDARLAALMLRTTKALIDGTRASTGNTQSHEIQVQAPA